MANSKQIARDTLGAAALCLVWKKEAARKEFTEKLASCVFPITSDEITPAFHVNPSITMNSSYINCTGRRWTEVRLCCPRHNTRLYRRTCEGAGILRVLSNCVCPVLDEPPHHHHVPEVR